MTNQEQLQENKTSNIFWVAFLIFLFIPSYWDLKRGVHEIFAGKSKPSTSVMNQPESNCSEDTDVSLFKIVIKFF